jgi:signal transduction histidine kinase/DNA-binding response OmpR family regulator/HAMP domain-containing protein
VSVAKKLAALILIALIPLLALSGLWLSGEVSRTITAPSAALAGTKTVESLLPLLRTAEELRGLAARRAAGDASVQPEIELLSVELTDGVNRARAEQPTEQLREFVARRLPALAPGEPVALSPALSPTEAMAEYQELIDTLLTVAHDAGAYSGLLAAADYRERLYANIALTALPRLLDDLYIVRDLARLAELRGDLLPDEEQLLLANLDSSRTRLDRLQMTKEEVSARQLGDASSLTQGSQQRAELAYAYLDDARALLLSDDIRATEAEALARRSNEVTAELARDLDILRDLEGRFEARQSSGRARIAAAVTLNGMALLAICGLGAFLLRDVLGNLKVAVDFATSIAAGRRDVELRKVARDEFGTLHGALRDMLDSIRQAEHQLVNSNRELTQQARVRQGQVDAASTIRREPAPEPLAQAILAQLAATVGAASGCLYLARNGSIDAAAGFCLPPEREGSSLKLGHGIAGQAAAERRTLRASAAPDGALRLVTCAGDAEVREVIAVPLEFSEVRVGVVELASLGMLNEVDVACLEALTEIVAAGLLSALTREQIEELLQETTQQREALREANEELAHRAAEMEMQQTELSEVNRELQAQSDQLEHQKEELEAANQALRTSQAEIVDKVESLEVASRYKSEFLANMSHELRTPLNSILILAKLLAEDEEAKLDPDTVASAATIHAAGRDLLTLINDILDLAKVEAGKLTLASERIELRELASDLERAFAPQMRERGLAFAASITPACPTYVDSDRLRVEQVLRNFLSNAVKFTEQGRVNLNFDAAPASARGYAVSLSVSDTGIGIPLDEQEAVFEAFRQGDGSTERRYGGTGLGLSIARAFAERLGGTITLTSQVGEGSCFTLLLPPRLEVTAGATDAATARPAASGAPTRGRAIADGEGPADGALDDDRQAARRGDPIVLIIEDDPEFAATLVRGVRRAGLQAVVACDAERGLDDARSLEPVAILLDHRLPGMSGQSALAHLKLDPRTRHLPVHVISIDEIGRDVRRRGAAGFMHKPARDEDIERVLEDLMNRTSASSRRVLLVEDDGAERQAVQKLLAATEAEVVAVGSAEEALEKVRQGRFDCVILDLKLRGTSGFDFLSSLEREPVPPPPVIVYTGRDLSNEEIDHLEQRAGSIIIKGAKSPERLLDEVTLYLHSVEDRLPDQHRDMLARARRGAHDLSGRRILIADDDMRNVYSLRRALQGFGVAIEVATTGRAAVARLAEQPSVDLVLMDVMMPDLDGLEATRQLRRQRATADLPIIALTAKAMKGDRELCLAAGANDYLAKPVEISELLDRVELWLQ